MLIIDSQRALEFLVPQLATIEKTVYKIRYPSIRYQSLIPVDTTANPWTPSIVYYSSDVVGAAQWTGSQAQDIPNVELKRSQATTGVHMASIGFRYNMEEVALAQQLGQNLNADKASGCRLGYEKFVDNVALYGDADKGFQGLFNTSYVTVVAVPNVGGNTTFATKTPAQVLADVNGLLTGIYTGSDTVELADTLCLPISIWSYLTTTPFNQYSEKTLLRYIQENNVYTAETGQPLNIRGVRGLDTAGAGNTTRIVAYRKAEEVLKLHLPMPLRFLPVWQKGPMEFEIPGVFRMGGTDVRLPGAIRYMDGA